MRAPGIDVVVPSYRRPVALIACLDALAVQVLPPTRVLVVARPDDTPTWEAARAAATRHGEVLPLEVVPVEEAGLVAALRAGTAATSASRVAFTDDDAVPHPEWLAALGGLLDEPGVGGAGGRDLVPGELGPGRRTVGTLAPWGRYTGDHHLGRGPARDVHVVKGVNMAYRADALALPRSGVLAGQGAEIHSEELICAWARARGWRIRYDPAITVDHRVRADESVGAPDDMRGRESYWRAGAHNRMVGTIATDPDRAAVHVAYGVLVGSRESPGVARALVALARRERHVLQRVRASLGGQTEAVRALFDHDVDDLMVSCAELRREHTRTR